MLGAHSDYVMALACAPSTSLLASAGLGGQLFLWDLTCGKATAVHAPSLARMEPDEVTGAKDSLYCVAIDDAGTLVASGGPEQVVRLWDTRSATKVCKLRGHTENVRSLVIDATGRTCISGSSDGTVRVWDIGLQRCISTFTAHTDSVWTLTFGGGQKVVYSGSRDKSVYAHVRPSVTAHIRPNEPLPQHSQ